MLKKAFSALFLVSLGLLLSSCIESTAPEVKYLDYKLGKVTNEGIEVNFNFEVKNPNPVPIDVTGYSYKVFINDKELASADRQGFNLPASDKTRVTVPAFVRYEQLLGSAISLLDRLAKGIDSFDYRVEGTVKAQALGLTVSSPLNASGTIPIPKNIKVM